MLQGEKAKKKIVSNQEGNTKDAAQKHEVKPLMLKNIDKKSFYYIF